MQYRKWLETAARLQIRLINWPNLVPPLGPDFDIKKLNARHLDSLVSGYITNIKNGNENCVVPQIVRWSAGKVLFVICTCVDDVAFRRDRDG